MGSVPFGAPQRITPGRWRPVRFARQRVLAAALPVARLCPSLSLGIFHGIRPSFERPAPGLRIFLCSPVYSGTGEVRCCRPRLRAAPIATAAPDEPLERKRSGA